MDAVLSLPEVAGAFVIVAVLLLIATVILLVFLRPDPLLTAREHDAARVATAGGAPAGKTTTVQVISAI